MAKVTFFPMGKTLEVNEETTLLELALEHKIPMAHACGGFCACTTCHVEVKSGAENLSEIEENEEERLERVSVGLTLNSRLGCQAKIRGDVTVEIKNIDESQHG